MCDARQARHMAICPKCGLKLSVGIDEALQPCPACLSKLVQQLDWIGDPLGWLSQGQASEIVKLLEVRRNAP